MPDDPVYELGTQFRAAQYKYTYFILAAAGAAIAFAVSQTQGLPLSWSQIPLGCAVLSWGLSFFSGCRFVVYLMSSLYANAELFKVAQGQDEVVGCHPQKIEAAKRGILKGIEANSEVAAKHSKRQDRYLISGAVFYVGWHVLEMWLRISP